MFHGRWLWKTAPTPVCDRTILGRLYSRNGQRVFRRFVFVVVKKSVHKSEQKHHLVVDSVSQAADLLASCGGQRGHLASRRANDHRTALKDRARVTRRDNTVHPTTIRYFFSPTDVPCSQR